MLELGEIKVRLAVTVAPMTQVLFWEVGSTRRLIEEESIRRPLAKTDVQVRVTLNTEGTALEIRADRSA